MDIRMLIGVVLVVIVVAAGVGYMRESAPETFEEEIVVAPEPEEVPVNGTSTLQSLLSRDGSYRCNIESGEISSEGTIYVALGKLRGDFRTRAVGGVTVASHLIASDGYVYTWSDFSTRGVVTELDVSGRAPSALLSASVDYHCSQWEADQNVFVLPPGVSFVHP